MQDSPISATLLITELVSNQSQQTKVSSPGVVTEHTKTRSRHSPLLDILHSSMFSQPNLSYDCRTLFDEIAVSVLQTLLQLVRIEKICFTAKNIQNLNKARRRRRIKKYDDSSSDSDEDEDEDDD